jgi:hypothetical protein
LILRLGLEAKHDFVAAQEGGSPGGIEVGEHRFAHGGSLVFLQPGAKACEGFAIGTLTTAAETKNRKRSAGEFAHCHLFVFRRRRKDNFPGNTKAMVRWPEPPSDMNTGVVMAIFCSAALSREMYRKGA